MEEQSNEDQLTFDDQDIINISYPKIKNILESLLFVTKKPLTVDEIRKVMRIDKKLIERSLHELIAEYSGKGVVIAKIAGGFQMVTNSDNAKFVDKLLKSPIETTLSQAALEALSIISYKQPVTRGEIENVRGVASDGVLQTLVEKRLVAEVGRSSGLGRPRLYGTTVEFLRHFGLKELADLPPLPVDEMGHEIYRSALPEEKINSLEGTAPGVEAKPGTPQPDEEQKPEELQTQSETEAETEIETPSEVNTEEVQAPQPFEMQEPSKPVDLGGIGTEIIDPQQNL